MAIKFHFHEEKEAALAITQVGALLGYTHKGDDDRYSQIKFQVTFWRRNKTRLKNLFFTAIHKGAACNEKSLR